MRQVTAGTRSFGFFETYFGECTVNINGTLLVQQTRVNGELDRQMDRHRKKEREREWKRDKALDIIMAESRFAS